MSHEKQNDPAWLQKLRSEATEIRHDIAGFGELIVHPDVRPGEYFMINPDWMIVEQVDSHLFVEPDLRQPNFD